MAKSKKKFGGKKRPSSGPPKPMDRSIKLWRKDAKGNYAGLATLALPDIGNGDGLESVIYLGPLRESVYAKQVTARALERIHAAADDPAKQMRLIKDSEMAADALHSYVCTELNKYMQNISEFDQTLNAYGEDTSRPGDLLDFSDLVNNYLNHDDIPDVVHQMQDIVTADGFVYDPSYTWSTNEYFCIKFSETLRYACKRLLYDEREHSARYLCVEYRDFTSVMNRRLRIATLWFVFEITDARINMDTLECTHAEHMQFDDDWSFRDAYKADKMYGGDIVRAIVNSFVEAYGPQFNTLRFNIMGWRTLGDVLAWHRDNKKKAKDREAWRLTEDMLAGMIAEDIYKNDTILDIYRSTQAKDNIKQKYSATVTFHERLHVTAACSLVTSALVITNQRLKEKKLSRPIHVADPAAITHEKEIILENRPERKTRILDGVIRITSDEKPEAPTLEKIIKYHIPEWGRKEHLRRLKSGKIVKVKAATCKRKCVDMHDVKSKLPKQDTDYIVKHPKKEVIPNGN